MLRQPSCQQKHSGESYFCNTCSGCQRCLAEHCSPGIFRAPAADQGTKGNAHGAAQRQRENYHRSNCTTWNKHYVCTQQVFRHVFILALPHSHCWLTSLASRSADSWFLRRCYFCQGASVSFLSVVGANTHTHCCIVKLPCSSCKSLEGIRKGM